MDRTECSFDDFCRICATQSNYVQNLFEIVHNGIALAEMLGFCLKRQINRIDGLPQNICAICKNNLISSFEFHSLCETSEQYFLKQCIPNNRYHGISTHTSVVESMGSNRNREIVLSQIKTETDSELDHIDANFDYGIKSDEPMLASEMICVEESFDINNVINENEPEFVEPNGRPQRRSSSKIMQAQKIHPKIEAKVYECFECRRRFDEFNKLRAHMNDHDSSRKPYECTICKMRFVHMNSWFRHRARHNKSMHDCEYCSEAFDTLPALKQHIQEFHKEQMDAYKCNDCSKKFALHFLLLCHLERHKNAKTFVCNTCDAVFFSDRKLKGHIRDKHASKC